MPKPAPLPTPHHARRALAHRLTGLADRLRQLNTRFGLRGKRVFLVWTKVTGAVRGEGDENVLARVELLPTPKVADMSAVALNPYSAGRVPVGMVRLTEVSAGAFTRDQLMGRRVPGRTTPLEEPYDFFYELVEDGRGDAQPVHQRFRVAAEPDRREGMLQWSLLLERAAEDMARDGTSNLGEDD